MREIKFRAWDNVEKEMHVCGDDMDVIFNLSIDGIECVDVRDIRPSGDSLVDKNHLIYLQYTGLKDRNFVEIYEGDIVENGNGKVGYVVFLIQETGFVVVLKDKDYRLGHRNTGGGYSMADKHKVIGNIYENPELLEEVQ